MTPAQQSAEIAKAVAEMVGDYKAGARFTDGDIRATAKRFNVDACALYAAFNDAIRAA